MGRKDVLGLSELMKAAGTRTPTSPSPPAPPAAPAAGEAAPSQQRGSAFNYGAVGGMRTSLTEAANRSVQDIDTALIGEFGPNDRLAITPESVAELAEAIRSREQIVPVLLRPDPEAPGRYLVVYGRRRILAARSLGIPVRALVRNLGVEESLVARGQENAHRLNPSFIEKVMFMRGLIREGYDMQVVQEAISVERTTLSRMMTISDKVSEELVRWIGAAPGIGRRRWIDLADRIEESRLAPADLMSRLPETEEADSDRRFEIALAAIAEKRQKPPAPPTPKRQLMIGERRVAETKMAPSGLTMKIFASGDDGFADWFDQNASRLLAEAHADWKRKKNGK